MDDLHYSAVALGRRCLWMLAAALLVLADEALHAPGRLPLLFGLGVVASVTLIAVALYLVVVTMILTMGLIRHGGVAATITADGISLHRAWSTRTFPWSELAQVALDVRYTRLGHFPVVAVRTVDGIARYQIIDARLLAEPLDRVDAWAERAEQARLAHGGAPFVVPSSGLAGYSARRHAADIAPDVAAAQATRPV